MRLYSYNMASTGLSTPCHGEPVCPEYYRGVEPSFDKPRMTIEERFPSPWKGEERVILNPRFFQDNG